MTQIPPKIYVAGHRGMVGSAIVRQLMAKGHPEDRIIGRTHSELDLTDQAAVRDFMASEKPDQVYLAAARVGGIHANNTYPAEFIYDNLMVQSNVIDAAFRNGVRKLLFLGSSCIYPKLAPQPMSESSLLTGLLEPTALLRRFHEAKVGNAPSVTIWGSGKPYREFLYVDDMASASVFVMNLPKAKYDTCTSPMLSHINVGSGSDITIAQLAHAVKTAVGYAGDIVFDTTKPDGTPRKLMDSARINALGWAARVDMAEGLGLAYQDFVAGLANKAP